MWLEAEGSQCDDCVIKCSSKTKKEEKRNETGGFISTSQTTLLVMANHLRAVVEVVPVVASANPVIVGSCVVGLVVGVGRLVEVLTSRGVLGGSSGVEAGGGLSVKSREHFV